MRSVYLDNANSKPCVGEIFSVQGEEAFHLIRVVRIQQGKDILLLDGKGSIYHGRVSEILKNEVRVLIEREEFKTSRSSIDLAICMVKKEAMEEIVKIAVETGMNAICPLFSSYSWQHFIPSDRLHRLIVSALIQSNNPYYPKILEPTQLKQFSFEQYDQIYYFSSRGDLPSSSLANTSLPQKQLILIGPEGGLEEKEEDFIIQQKNVHAIHLPIPILTSPTAVAVASGYVLAYDKKQREQNGNN